MQIANEALTEDTVAYALYWQRLLGRFTYAKYELLRELSIRSNSPYGAGRYRAPQETLPAATTGTNEFKRRTRFVAMSLVRSLAGALDP